MVEKQTYTNRQTDRQRLTQYDHFKANVRLDNADSRQIIALGVETVGSIAAVSVGFAAANYSS